MLYQNAELHNVVELLPLDRGAGLQMLRLPNSVRSTLNSYARDATVHPAGCEIRFNMKEGSTAKIVLSPSKTKVYPLLVEVYQGCFRTQMEYVRGEATELIIRPSFNQAMLAKISAERKLPFDPRLTRVLLPPLHPVRLIGIEGDITPPTPDQTPQRRYLAYGSSITHGFFSCRPSGSYPMMIARDLQADLINQGYGGGARLEETMAQYLAGLRYWDFATLEMGVNVGDWRADQFARAVKDFIRIIGSAHRDKWVFCIDVFTFQADFDPSNKFCDGFREVMRHAVAEANLPRLVYVNGRDILGDVTGLSQDLTHPTDDGFVEISRNLASVMRRTMQ